MCVRRTLRSMPWTKRICSAHHEIMAWADTVCIIYGLGKCEFTRNLKCVRWSLGVAGRENFCILKDLKCILVASSYIEPPQCQLYFREFSRELYAVVRAIIRGLIENLSVLQTWAQWKSIQEFCYVRTSTIRSFASMANVAVFPGTLL